MIPYSRQLIEADDIEALVEALQGSHLTQGGKVEEFENALAVYEGVQGAAVMNSATSALLSAYKAIGLKEGDEVITTPITFMATSNMLLELGARPVFCDVKFNGNIDESKIEALITTRTKAVVSVDFGGNPVEYEVISAICKKHALFFISDASHALGSKYHGKEVAKLADATIFSFHAIKPITTGEGGAVLSNDDALIERIKLFRSHGIVKKKLWNSDAETLGFNFRLPDINCALGISQLKKLDTFLERRNTIAEIYDREFDGNEWFSFFKVEAENFSARHLYPIRLNREFWCPKEDIFQEFHESGIGVQVHYKPIYQFTLYKKLMGEMRLQSADEFYNSELSLPCHQAMSDADVAFVIERTKNIFQNHKRRGGCSL